MIIGVWGVAMLLTRDRDEVIGLIAYIEHKLDQQALSDEITEKKTRIKGATELLKYSNGLGITVQ